MVLRFQVVQFDGLARVDGLLRFNKALISLRPLIKQKVRGVIEMDLSTQSFDPVALVDQHWKGLKFMNTKQARKIEEIIVANDYRDTLELGFAHGKSSAYISSVLKSLGRGHHTAIDWWSAETTREPNIHQVLDPLDVGDFTTLHFEQQSYTWRLMKFIEERPKHQFDFCYLDGGHTWDVSGFGFFLVDLLLKPGGTIVLDDLDWTLKKGMPEQSWIKCPDQDFREEFLTTPQVRKVFELIAGNLPQYECSEWEGWGIAKKIA